MPLDATTSFTPWPSLFGGVLIGVSAVMVLGLLGRIAGIAGITRGAVTGGGERPWRVAFIVGLAIAPILVGVLQGAPVEQVVSSNLVAMALAGLLVGVGTTLGAGCTSGHGVCGMARLSPRSIAATATFFCAALATVFVLRHGLAGFGAAS